MVQRDSPSSAVVGPASLPREKQARGHPTGCSSADGIAWDNRKQKHQDADELGGRHGKYLALEISIKRLLNNEHKQRDLIAQILNKQIMILNILLKFAISY